MIIEKKMIVPTVYGGAFYGGGGGGWIKDGLKMASVAVSYGLPDLVDLDELSGEDILCMTSMIGAPAAKEQQVLPADYIRSYKLLAYNVDEKIAGLVTNENGAVATINGWIQSSVLGIPVVDAPGNGRAHPTGLMGSMGLNTLDSYISQQTAVGGNPKIGKYIELYGAGNIHSISSLVRQAADRAGGMVAVTRNPVTAKYVKENGAPGAVKKALKVGQALLNWQDKGPSSMIKAAAEEAEGQVVAEGIIDEFKLDYSGGFDVGRLSIKSNKGTTFTIDIWNEYLTLESEGERLATFPDLVVLMNAESGLPVISAEAAVDMPVHIVVVPRGKLILGAGMFQKSIYIDMEKAIGKEIVKYF